MEANKKTTLIAIGFIIAGVFCRLIPHIPNFSPVEAIALLGGAYIGRRILAFLVPLVTLYFSDLVLNNTILRSFFPDQEGFILFSSYMTWNFLAMLLIVVIGFTFLKKIRASNLILAAIASSVLFFLITNFGVWASSVSIYPKTISGLISSYVAAWPFFKTSLLSSLFFTLVIFGGFELVKRYYIKTKPSVA